MRRAVGAIVAHSPAKHHVARLWQRVPVFLRWRILWLTQSTYTVGVSAVVLNDHKEVLLLRHRFRDSTGWELPGGFVTRGESLEGALQRELQEETGLDIHVDSPVIARIPKPLHLDLCFLAGTHGRELRVETDEIIDARFFPIDHLPPGLDGGHMSYIRAALRQLNERSQT